jgi:hypothetical protein
MVYDIMDVPRILQGSNISIFRSLPSWKVDQLLGSPGRHPRSLRGRWRFLRGVFEVCDIRDVPRIHKGSYVSIFTSLPSWKVVKLLGFSRASSKESKRTLEVPERSLGGFDIKNVPRIHEGSYVSIFRSLPSLKFVQLLGEGGTNRLTDRRM